MKIFGNIDLLEQMRYTFEYIESEENWTSGVISIFGKSMNFLLNLAMEVDNIVVPTIMVCNDGSIDISFSREIKYDQFLIRSLINIKENEYSFYCAINDHSSNKKTSVISGTITGHALDADLLNWIKINLKNEYKLK